MFLKNEIKNKLLKNVGAKHASSLTKCLDVMALSNCCQIFYLVFYHFCNQLIEDSHKIHTMALICSHGLSNIAVELVTINGHSSIEATWHALTTNSYLFSLCPPVQLQKSFDSQQLHSVSLTPLLFLQFLISHLN